jgi:hypothetical protein
VKKVKEAVLRNEKEREILLDLAPKLEGKSKEEILFLFKGRVKILKIKTLWDFQRVMESYKKGLPTMSRALRGTLKSITDKDIINSWGS